MNNKIRKTLSIEFPIDIEQGEAGLVYVTSPLVRGLLIARETEAEALAEAPQALADLTKAKDEHEGR
jgi:hypothetical protein